MSWKVDFLITFEAKVCILTRYVKPNKTITIGLVSIKDQAFIENLTRVIISYEIYKTSLGEFEMILCKILFII